MGADGGADIVDDRFAVHLFEGLRDEVGDGFGVLFTGRHGQEHLAGIVFAAFGVFDHLVHDLLDDGLLAADLVAGDQPAEVVHVQQRADLQHRAEPAGSLGDAAAADVEGEVRREEPVVQAELVGLGPVRQFRKAHALVPLVGEGVHQQTVAAGGAEGIEDDDLPLGVLLEQEVSRRTGGVVDAGDARGQGQVQDVLPLFEERREVVDELFDVDLGRAGHGAVCHLLVERVGVHGLIKVVRVLDVVEVVVEADIVDVPLLKFCFREVCRGTAAQDVISHVGGPPYVLRFAGRLPAANILYEVHPVQDHPRVGDVPLPCGFYGSIQSRARTLPAGESSFLLLLCGF